MCRTGGRRCPSHTQPELIEQRNEERREQYANKKLRDKTASRLQEYNVPFVRGDEVKEAYFQGKESFAAEKFQPIQDSENPSELASQVNLFWSKPEAGGLWSSPGHTDEDGTVKTQWTDWSHDNQFEVKDIPLNPLKVRKQAVVVELSTTEDVDALIKAYPAKTGPGFSYEKMASDGIDGVRLTQEGVRNSKGFNMEHSIHNFSMWDIDSTVWINSDNISSGKPVPKGHYESNYEDYDDRPYDDDYDPNESIEDILKEFNLKTYGTENGELEPTEKHAGETSDIQEDEAMIKLRKLLVGDDKV